MLSAGIRPEDDVPAELQNDVLLVLAATGRAISMEDFCRRETKIGDEVTRSDITRTMLGGF